MVVGTPGRLLDMMKKGHLSLSYLKIFVIDEADELLSRGFKESLKDIFSYLPTDCQVALFSATLPENVIETSK